MCPAETPAAPQGSPALRRAYVPAIGPRLKILLYVVFVLAAILGANSIYLGSISLLEFLAQKLDWRQKNFQTYFSIYQLGLHIGLGLLFIVPFVVFGFTHLFTARKRKNKRAIRVGYGLFAVSLVLLATGLLLSRLSDDYSIKDGPTRRIVYWGHILAPLVVVWLYWLHRLAGQKIRWKLGLAYLGVTLVVVGAMMDWA